MGDNKGSLKKNFLKIKKRVIEVRAYTDGTINNKSMYLVDKHS